MFLIFMIAGGVTIQAVLYPHWPLTTELVKRVLTRPIYAMFLTQVDDLDGENSSFIKLYHKQTFYSNPSLQQKLMSPKYLDCSYFIPY